jgi:type I restriction enzyme S subunit
VDELMALCDELEAAHTKRERRRDRLVAATLHGLNNGETDFKAKEQFPFEESARFYFSHLPRLTTRPEHIQQLRQTIINLAVRGKLVEQNPEDEPAEDLLKRIAEEKKRRFGGSDKKTQTIDEDQIPFAIPDNWQWTQIAQIGVINPRNDAEDSTDASFVPMPLIFAEYGRANQQEVRPWSEIKKGFTHFAEGDVGLAKITPCFENRKSTIFRNLTCGIGAGTTELHIVRPVFVIPDYILIFLKSPYFIETGIPKMTGTAGQKRVPKDYFAFSPFPLPPLAEQHRIVAKVDELMTLCDELETRITSISITRRQLLETTLHEALNGSEQLHTHVS